MAGDVCLVEGDGALVGWMEAGSCRWCGLWSCGRSGYTADIGSKERRGDDLESESSTRPEVHALSLFAKLRCPRSFVVEGDGTTVVLIL